MEGLPFSQVCAFPAQTEKTAILYIVQLFPPARQAIPAQRNKNASRYQVSGVLEKERADSVLERIAEMKDSKTVVAAYHADDPNAGMANHAFLDKFSEKYSGRILEKYLVYTKDLQKDEDILMLPVYMVPFL